MSTQKQSDGREATKRQLVRIVDEDTIDLHFVSALAGDRDMSAIEKNKLARLKKRRGKNLYSDLLFVLSHQYLPAEQAENIWNHILEHKAEISAALERNVGIAVAALDFLSNITHQLDSPVLIAEAKMSIVADIALRDGLTGLYDRSTLLSKLRDEIRRYKRYGNQVSLIMLDIDNFKQINDQYGHQRGDWALLRLSRIIQSEMRDVDIGARYGGEEFAIALPQTGVDEAISLAERVRQHVEEECANDLKMTISLGVATCPKDAQTVHDLVQQADKALYQSKMKGKNRVTKLSRSNL
jgi:diguanylate cyclase (GGDEF)-like protein